MCCGYRVGWNCAPVTPAISSITTANTDLAARALPDESGLFLCRPYGRISLILVPAVKGWVSGQLGTFVSCYLQMFYVSFLFPWLFTHFENRGTESVGADDI